MRDYKTSVRNYGLHATEAIVNVFCAFRNDGEHIIPQIHPSFEKCLRNYVRTIALMKLNEFGYPVP